MQNQNHIRFPENMADEDKFHNEGIISFIDNDYVLSFLNDPESAQRRYFSFSLDFILQGQCLLSQTILTR